MVAFAGVNAHSRLPADAQAREPDLRTIVVVDVEVYAVAVA